MEEQKKATEANAQPIATGEQAKVTVDEDLEARNAQLEAEKAKLIEESANYRLAYLKEAKKNKVPEDEDEDAKIRRIAQEALAESRLAQIVAEQEAIVKKALKENKELKLAQMNKPGVPVSTGSSSEPSALVKDTLVTDEQIAAFKKMGWDDKKIERYKRNLQKNAR